MTDGATSAEQALRHRVAMEQLISRISRRFMELPPEEADRAIDEALAGIGAFAGVDRTYVFRVYDEPAVVSNTHEWCAPGIEPEIDNLQELPQEMYEGWMGILREQRHIHIPLVSALQDEMAAERELLASQSIQSLLSVGMFAEKSLFGFIGLDSVKTPCTWSDEDIALLEAAAAIVTAAMVRQANHVALREQERRLQQAQKLEAVGRLAGGVAHDFNNLLTVINGHAELLMAGTEGDSALRADLRAVLEAGRAAARLSSQLLAFGRRQVVVRKVFDPNVVIEEVAPVIRRLVGDTVRFVFTPGPDAGRIKADEGQFEQMLVNLALNAREAMSDGGTIRVSTERVALGGEGCARRDGLVPGAHLCLRFADEGAGMDEEQLAHVFEPFYTTKQSGQGVGLGLATVYGSVRQGGGAIEVSSELGKGSTFTIWFPLAQDPLVAESTRRSARVEGDGETVLVVEDDPAVRRIASRILSAAHFRTVEADSGEEALALFGKDPAAFDLLLTDVVMPGLDGRELSRRVLAERPELPVAFMSGYTDDELRRETLESDTMCFLQKPFSAGQLVGALRGLLSPR